MAQQNLPHNSARDITPPVHLTTTFEVTWDEARRLARGDSSQGDDEIPFYARYGNPTIWEVEEHLRQLCAPPERINEYSSLVTSSGMAAISTTLLALLHSGDEILATDTIYGGTSKLLRETLPRFGITTRFTSCDLRDAFKHITPNTKLMWVESPANPTNRLISFHDATQLAKNHHLISCIDATFGPPPLQQPLAHSFDVEIHAATKYMGGHSDLLAGAIIGRRDLVEKIRHTHRVLGATLDAHAAFLLRRGLLTLPLRLRQINESAIEIAQFLSTHRCVTRVHYLGLESHADHAAAKLQMPGGFGGIVAFDLEANQESAAEKFVSRLRLVRHAPSLGGAETLVSYPLLASHANQSEQQLQAAGITRGTVRLSIGLEEVAQIKEDLDQALGDF